MLATEQTTDGENHRAEPTGLESWNANERMRHIPPLTWMIEKLDGDLRRRIEILCAPVEMLFSDDPARAAADAELHAVCKALERLANTARHARQAGHVPHDPTRQVVAALNQAIGALRSLDADLIGRRYPFHTFERSKAEPLYGALVAVICAIERLVGTVRQIDADIDGRLGENLVHLEQELREDPIA